MSTNQSIKRAFFILDTIAAHGHGRGVTEIASATNLHKSTVSRMLATLEEAGSGPRSVLAAPVCDFQLKGRPAS